LHVAGSAVHKAVTQIDDTKEKEGASKQQKLSGIDRDPPQTKLSGITIIQL